MKATSDVEIIIRNLFLLRIKYTYILLQFTTKDTWKIVPLTTEMSPQFSYIEKINEIRGGTHHMRTITENVL